MKNRPRHAGAEDLRECGAITPGMDTGAPCSGDVVAASIMRCATPVSDYGYAAWGKQRHTQGSGVKDIRYTRPYVRPGIPDVSERPHTGAYPIWFSKPQYIMSWRLDGSYSSKYARRREVLGNDATDAWLGSRFKITDPRKLYVSVEYEVPIETEWLTY